MNTRISRLTVLQTGKLLAVLYGFIAVVAFPFMLISIMASPRTMFPMLFTLLLYPVMGFIGGILMAVFYNLAAKWVGGLEVTLETPESE